MRRGHKGRRVTSRASDTAEINAAQRAIETRRRPDQRLIEDPYARYFVRRPAYRALTRFAPVGLAGLRVIDWRLPGLNAIILLRARYATDVVKDTAGAGVEQLVLLGAGYDSIALRHEEPPLVVYEVDSPATQEAKRRCVAESGLTPRQEVVYVPCDFERDSARERLTEAGFDTTRPCTVVWFGVSYYLTREAVSRALEDAAAVSAPGSTLLVDYMDPAIPDLSTDHAGARRLARSVIRRGEPYRSGYTDTEIEEVLGAAGFALREQLRMPDLGRRYGGADGPWCRTDDLVGVVRAERDVSHRPAQARGHRDTEGPQ